MNDNKINLSMIVQTVKSIFPYEQHPHYNICPLIPQEKHFFLFSFKNRRPIETFFLSQSVCQFLFILLSLIIRYALSRSFS